MIRTAPIQFSAVPDQWRSLLEALGMRVVVDEPGWTVMRAGGGVIAIHASEPDEARTELWFEASDPAAVGDQLAATGVPVTADEPGDTTTLRRCDMPDGQLLGLSHWNAAEDGAGGPLQVLPLWMTPDVAAAASHLETLGARPQLSSDDGGWVQLATDDGLVAAHAGDLGTVLSFDWDGSIDALHTQLAARGVTSRVIDEAYGRTLRIDHPDGAEELWVNEKQTDLHGYRDHTQAG